MNSIILVGVLAVAFFAGYFIGFGAGRASGKVAALERDLEVNEDVK